MTLGEMKKHILALIEELDAAHPMLTSDPDLAAKLAVVINAVAFELARLKKPALYLEVAVEAGQRLTLQELGEKAGRQVYQVALVTGAKHHWRAGGTVLVAEESGTLGLDCYVYPRPVTADTHEDFKLDLSPDVLEILPYGVAADILKSDASAAYGQAYAQRYERLLQRLDPRNQLPAITIAGGVAL